MSTNPTHDGRFARQLRRRLLDARPHHFGRDRFFGVAEDGNRIKVGLFEKMGDRLGLERSRSRR